MTLLENKFIKTISEEEVLMKYNLRFSFSLLCDIVIAEDVDALNYFVEQGYDINMRAINANSVAHYLENTSVDFFEEMVRLGLNFKAINRFGETALMVLATTNKNIPLQKRLVEKGLNPYDSNFNGYSSAMFVLRHQSEVHDFYKEHENKPAEFLDVLFKNGDYLKAFVSTSETIHNLGGLEMALGYSGHSSYIQLLIYRFQLALAFSNHHEELAALTNMVLAKNVTPTEREINRRFSIASLFASGDVDTLFRYLNYVSEIHKAGIPSQHYSTELNIANGYLFAKLLACKDKIKEYERVLTRQFSYNEATKSIHELITEPNSVYSGSTALGLESLAGFYTDEIKGEILFTLGLYYLTTNNLQMAELIMRKIVNIFSNPDIRLTPVVLANAQIMIDYIQKRTSL